MRLLLLSLMMAAMLHLTTALSCVPCTPKRRRECATENAALQCKDRYSPPCSGYCGCEACSKGLGQECGGPWGLDGQCRKHLKCQPPPDLGHDTFTDTGFGYTGTCQYKWQPTTYYD